jgi:hypothetical protein
VVVHGSLKGVVTPDCGARQGLSRLRGGCCSSIAAFGALLPQIARARRSCVLRRAKPGECAKIGRFAQISDEFRAVAKARITRRPSCQQSVKGAS